MEWYVNVALGVHPDFKGHTGVAMKFKDRKGSPIQHSSKQKLNMSSSTMCKPVQVGNVLPMILWTPLFLKKQGYKVNNNVVMQDNTSAILLEKNGKQSSGERTCIHNTRYFVITDHMEKGDLEI